MGAKKAKTEKIKVTVNTTEVKELEISFPYYTKNGGLYCKFLSKDEAMWVCEYGFSRAIEHSTFGTPENWLAFKPTTEAVFNEAFDKVMNNLIKMNNEKVI